MYVIVVESSGVTNHDAATNELDDQDCLHVVKIDQIMKLTELNYRRFKMNEKEWNEITSEIG